MTSFVAVFGGKLLFSSLALASEKNVKEIFGYLACIYLVKLYSNLTRPGPPNGGLGSEIPFIAGKSWKI